jgi:hypothetical protein
MGIARPKALSAGGFGDPKQQSAISETPGLRISEQTLASSSGRKPQSIPVANIMKQKVAKGHDLHLVSAAQNELSDKSFALQEHEAPDLAPAHGRARGESEFDELAQLIKLADEENQAVQSILGSEPFSSVDCAFPVNDDVADERVGFMLDGHGTGSASDFPLLTMSQSSATANEAALHQQKPAFEGQLETLHADFSNSMPVTSTSGLLVDIESPAASSAILRRTDFSLHKSDSGDYDHRLRQDRQMTAAKRTTNSPASAKMMHHDHSTDSAGTIMMPDFIHGLQSPLLQRATRSAPSRERSRQPQIPAASSKHASSTPWPDAAQSASDATGPDAQTLRKRETHNFHTRISRQKISQCFEHLVTVLTAGCAHEETDLIVCNELDGACMPELRTVCACCGLDCCARPECLECKATGVAPVTMTEGNSTQAGLNESLKNTNTHEPASKNKQLPALNEPGTCCGWRDRVLARRQRAGTLRQRLRHRAEMLQYATHTIIQLRRERRLLELHLLMESETFRRSWIQQVLHQVLKRDQSTTADANTIFVECCKPLMRAVLEYFQWPLAEIWIQRAQPAVIENEALADLHMNETTAICFNQEATLIVPLIFTRFEHKTTSLDVTSPERRLGDASEAQVGSDKAHMRQQVQPNAPGIPEDAVVAVADNSCCTDPSKCSASRGPLGRDLVGNWPRPSLETLQPEQDVVTAAAAAQLIKELEHFAVESKKQTPSVDCSDIQHLAFQNQRPVGVRIRASNLIGFDPETDSLIDIAPSARLALAQQHQLKCLVAIPAIELKDTPPGKRLRAAADAAVPASIRGVLVVGHVLVNAPVQPLLRIIQALLACLLDEMNHG